MSESNRGDAARREAERADIEARVRAAIAKNQEVLRAVSADASDAEYWGALRREGVPSKLRVRNLEGTNTTEQSDMYLLGEDGGHVEMTYFDGNELGEAFYVALDRIESIS